MTASFSESMLDAMGFQEPMAQGSIVASFISVSVYEVRGVSLPEGFSEAKQASVAGATYRIALSRSVNAGCQELVGEDFTESEPDWSKEVKSQGPFLLIGVGPTDFTACKSGRMGKGPDGSIETYDCFPGIREQLTSLESRVLPPVLAACKLALNQSGQYVSLRELARARVGRTSDKVNVRDVRIEVRAHGIVSRAVSAEQGAEALQSIVKQAPKLHPRATKYFALGMAEDDQLKRFLYFFLSLEVETHAVFGRLDHADKLRSQIFQQGLDAPRQSAAKLIHGNIAGWKSLYDRFVWCATCAWPMLTEEDIALFKELKNARDDIAHGNESTPPSGFARSAELLAQKILWMP